VQLPEENHPVHPRREGGEPGTSFKFPGKTSFDAVILTAGMTHDHRFEEWATAMP